MYPVPTQLIRSVTSMITIAYITFLRGNLGLNLDGKREPLQSEEQFWLEELSRAIHARGGTLSVSVPGVWPHHILQEILRGVDQIHLRFAGRMELDLLVLEAGTWQRPESERLTLELCLDDFGSLEELESFVASCPSKDRAPNLAFDDLERLLQGFGGDETKKQALLFQRN